MKKEALMSVLWVVGVLQAGSAWAWGPEGHEAVGRIASFYLTPTTRENLEMILGDKKISDPEVSCWADVIRGDKEYEKKYPHNGRWHFVDFDVKAKYSDEFELTLPEDGQDVVTQIQRWQKELAAPETTPERKLDALRFLVHFVGDLHQPMHCAYRYGDMGGNMIPVNSFQGESYSFDAETPMDYPPSLHSIWDEALVKELMREEKPRTFASRLRKGISAEQIQQWRNDDVMAWAVDSYWRARKEAYRWTNGENLPFTWSRPGMDLTLENYISSHLPIVQEQLQKGGIRLAHLLNSALDPDFDPTTTKFRK